MNVKNPLDIGPSPIHNKVLPMLLADPEIDMVLAIMAIPYVAIRHLKNAGVAVRDWFGDIASIRAQHPEKPLVGVVVGHPSFVEDIASICGRDVPVFTSPEPAAHVLAALWRYSKRRKTLLTGRDYQVGEKVNFSRLLKNVQMQGSRNPEE